MSSSESFEAYTLVLTPRLAATLIAATGCEAFTTGIGSCMKPSSGRYLIARDGADQACAPCIAWASLKSSTQQAYEPDPAGERATQVGNREVTT